MADPRFSNVRTAVTRPLLSRLQVLLFAAAALGTVSIALAADNKCYVRLKPDGGTVYGGNYQICRDYLRVLNAACEPPEVLLCGWNVPKGTANFQNVRWERLEPSQHLPLVEQIVRSGWKQKADQDEGWRNQEAAIRAAIDEGRTTLATASIDVNRDGVKDSVVKFSQGACSTLGTIMVVTDPERVRVDSRRTRVTQQFGLKDLLMHDGAAYLLTWEVGLHGDSRLRIWEGYSTTRGSGSQIVCEFAQGH